MATVLTLAGLGWATTPIMDSLYNGFARIGGNTSQPIAYPDFGPIDDGVAMLHNAIRSTSGQKIVVGHSKGAQIAGNWLRQHAGDPGNPPPSELSFVLTGNPDRKYGHAPWDSNYSTDLTPNYTQYTVKDIARYGDGWCNWPSSNNPFNTGANNPLGWASALAGMFTIHLLYFQVDINNPDTIDTIVEGNTTYYLVA